MKLLTIMIFTVISLATYSQEVAPKVEALSNTMTVSITSSGAFLFDMSSVDVRRVVLEIMLKQYSIVLTEEQKAKFLSVGAFGCSMQELPAYLDLSETDRKKQHNRAGYQGIPFQHGSELDHWISTSKWHGAEVGKAAWDKSRESDKSKSPEGFVTRFILLADKGATNLQLQIAENLFRINGYEIENSLPLSAAKSGGIRFVPVIHASAISANDARPDVTSVDPSSQPVAVNEPAVILTEYATFPGGRVAMLKYLAENRNYPERAVAEGLEGKCHLKFVVGKDGSISEVTVVKGVPDCHECDTEAIRLVRNMPNWIPEYVKGQPVSSIVNIPVIFKL